MALEKWLTSRGLERFRQEFGDLIERFPFEPGGPFRETSLRPGIESFVNDGTFTVRVDLPGVDPKNVDIKITSGVLTVKGSREQKHETKRRDFHRSEIRYGSFERAITLPQGMKAEDFKATYRDGVLELTAPMPEEAAPKEIKLHIEGRKAKK